MTSQSQSSRNIFASNTSRTFPLGSTKSPKQPKRPLPPHKTAPTSPKKFNPPQLNFSFSSSPKKAPPIPSRSNRPKTPTVQKLPLTRPLSARKHTSKPLPTFNKSKSKSNLKSKSKPKTLHSTSNFRSQVYFVDPLTTDLKNNHNQFTFGYESKSSRNIFAVPSNNHSIKSIMSPPNINTNSNAHFPRKHVKKSQSHSPIKMNKIHVKHKSSPIVHTAMKSVQVMNKFPKINKSKSKENNTHKSKKLPKRKLFNDTNFTEADLKIDDGISDNQIHWVRGDLIGTGAFGKVYGGYDKNTGKKCAIKQIPFDPNLKIKTKKKLIDKEAAIMKQLKHRNIIEFYGYQTSIKYKTLIILMELVIGITIEEYLHKNGPFKQKLIKKYVKQIISGLEFAHKMNIIHRDIKGRNILISNKGVIKLADFGSAKLCDATLSDLALQPSMDFSSTALWTAPEVLHNSGYNHKIDIWSLGCVIIEMATAKQPWSECKFDNPFAALYHIGQDGSVPQYPNTLSKKCKNFLKLCLIRDANKRCSARELLAHKFLDL